MKQVLISLSFMLLLVEVDAQCYQLVQPHFNLDTLTSPTSVILQDDQYSGLIPIGFPFCFYGNSYDSLLIGTNGIVSFDAAQATSYCPWPIGNSNPSSLNPANSIFAAWMDLSLPQGGTISYQTLGNIPNRKFVVYFDSVVIYSCTADVFIGQVKLYEGSNAIEIDIQQKSICTWNGSYAIEGIQDITGTNASVVPGRNYPSVWTATNDSWLFYPTCNLCTVVGIAETQKPELVLFVNDQNQIVINPNGNEYKVIGINNMLGQLINYSQSENSISFQRPVSGIYIVSLEVNGTSISRKVLIK